MFVGRMHVRAHLCSYHRSTEEAVDSYRICLEPHFANKQAGASSEHILCKWRHLMQRAGLKCASPCPGIWECSCQDSEAAGECGGIPGAAERPRSLARKISTQGSLEHCNCHQKIPIFSSLVLLVICPGSFGVSSSSAFIYRRATVSVIHGYYRYWDTY